MTPTLFIIGWVLSGFTTAALLIYADWRNGWAIKVEHFLKSMIITALGPIAAVIGLFMLAVRISRPVFNFTKVCMSTVVIKGRRRPREQPDELVDVY
jgi:formate-dependent nitrite reductase membrane component NrfD